MIKISIDQSIHQQSIHQSINPSNYQEIHQEILQEFKGTSMNFNPDWDSDQVDVWSSPQPSTSLHIHTSPPSVLPVIRGPTSGPSSPSSDTSTTPTVNNFGSHSRTHSFQPISEPSSSSKPISVYTDALSSPLPSLDTLASPTTPNMIFTPASDELSIQSVFSASSGNLTSDIQQDDLNFPQSHDQVQDDDDEFGDFDDPIGGLEDENEFQDFGGFASAQVSPVARASRLSLPVIPFKLPQDLSLDSLRTCLAPALDALFDPATLVQPPEKFPWLSSDEIPPTLTSTSPKSSTSKPAPPLILHHSDQLRQTWNSLMESRNGLGGALDWKRSQIRRHHLVNLGIPVDLNDFLTPAPLPKQRLSLETHSLKPSGAHSHSSSPSTSKLSPSHNSTAAFRTSNQNAQAPSVDQRRCKELLAIQEANLKTLSVEKLMAIRDELISMNTSVSDLLSHTLQMRDKLSQDNESYNTMISDLISAAQRIKMGSPNVAKRSSSIQLGSSSIASAGSTRWRTALSGPKPTTPTNTIGATSPSISAASVTSKRFSVL